MTLYVDRGKFANSQSYFTVLTFIAERQSATTLVFASPIRRFDACGTHECNERARLYQQHVVVEDTKGRITCFVVLFLSGSPLSGLSKHVAFTYILGKRRRSYYASRTTGCNLSRSSDSTIRSLAVMVCTAFRYHDLKTNWHPALTVEKQVAFNGAKIAR